MTCTVFFFTELCTIFIPNRVGYTADSSELFVRYCADK